MTGRIARTLGIVSVAVIVSGCGGGGLFGGSRTSSDRENVFSRDMSPETRRQLQESGVLPADRETIWDLFGGGDDPNVTVEVNRYLWNASLEVLDFMPVVAADPFSGIIQFGYGTPPGGSRAYRATVYVQDPALEARSLRVAVESRGGSVGRETARAIEDAILTRARQLRIRDGNL